jgi:CubicO group peptidase (beta-lactamase class C family)/tetratricopeptide (TPR) repeat protein
MDERSDASFDALDLDLALRIDELCQRFEADWRAGGQPRVDDYLAEIAEPGRKALRAELADLECELSRPSAASPGLEIRSDEPATPGEPEITRIRYFGDYEIVGEIARGGMGVVFEARQVSLNRRVALKMILAGQLADEVDVRRFYTEAEAAANLDHPGIVPIFEVGQHQGQHYFSMGFVEGPSLSQRLAAGPLPAREAAELIRRVSEAIDYAHRRGVIHRDLKPANILLDRGVNPRVTDFGLAKKVQGDSGLTGSGQIMGTPSYMPPEQAGSRRGDIGPAADVYALGATLYALVTGRPPFQAATAMDTVLQVIGDEPVPPRRLNAAVERDLETISLKCLEKDPARRYSSAEALGEDLGRYLAGEPILARPVTAWERAGKWARREPAIAGLAASLILALIAGFAAVTGQWFRAEALRDTAEGRRIDADTQRREAEDRRQQAEANFALARAAVDDFHTRVSQSRLREIPGLSSLRLELLGSARGFYDEFLRRKGDDPGLRFGLSAAQLRVAQIGAELDGRRAAGPAYRQALASYEALAREQPDDATVKAGLADCLRGLALAGPEGTSSRSLLERAQRIRAALARAQPESAETQLALARIEIDLAEEIRLADFPREALGWYEQARDIEQELVGARPDDPERLSTLGDTLGRMAQVLDRVGSPAEASMLRREAIEYLREARDRAPWVLGHGRLLGDLCQAEAATRRALKDSIGALAALEQAAAVRQALARENPDVGGVQAELIASLRSLLEALRASGRSAEVAKVLGQVRAWIEGLTRGSAEDYYQLAAILAGSPPRSRGEGVAVEAEPADESRRQAETAITALRKAVGAGFRDLDRLKGDPSFTALQGQGDFRTLIAQLEGARDDEVRMAASGRAPKGSDAARRTVEDLPRRILALREETARAHPDDPRRQAELARSRFAFGVSRLGLGNFGDAFHSLDQARAMQETLVRVQPRELRFRLDLSRTLLAVATAHVRLGRHAAAERSWRRAIAILERADGATANDREPELTRALAEAHLQAGRGYSGLRLWDEAAAEFAASFRLAEPAGPDHWTHYACLLRLLGDGDTYRRLSTRMLARYESSDDADAWAPSVATALAMASDAPADPARLLAVAERAIKAEPENLWNLLALAMAELRAGRFAASARRLEGLRAGKDEARQAWFARTPMVWPVLAMADHRLGRDDEARRWLDRADSWFDRGLREYQDGSGVGILTGTTWSDWAAFLALRREARGAIRGGSPSEDVRDRLASGSLRWAMGRGAAAEADLEAVVADPRWRDEPRAWIELGRVRAQAGQTDRADDAFARAAALAPEDPQLFLEHGWWLAVPAPADRELDPTSDIDPARPMAPGAPGGEPRTWTPTRTGYDGWIDFQSADPVSGPVEAAALGWIYAATDRDATLAVDASRRARVWLNGQLVHDGRGRPGPTGLGRTAVPIRLRKGRNPLLVRASVDPEATYYLRVFADRGDVEAPTGASTFIAEADEPAYLAWLDRMRKARYRPTSIQIIDGDGPLRFAALAASNPEGLAWEARIDRGEDAWNKTHEAMSGKRAGSRIASFTCASRSGEMVFVSIWHIADYLPPGNIYHWYNRTLETLGSRIAVEAEEGDLKPLAIVGYPDRGSTRYAVYGVPLQAGWRWLSPDLEMEPLLAAMEERLALGYHPVSLTSYRVADRRRFAMVLWRDDPAAPFWCQDVDPRRFAFLNAQQEARGSRPQFLTPKAPAGKVYYAGWTRQELPAGGEAAPALSGLESALKGFLIERGIRGATLAVAKGGRLLLARSFGWADRNATRPMAPGDPMRLASVGKLFTAAAIHKLIRDGKLKLGSNVVDLLDLKPPEGRTMDPRWKKVTIQHLLDHRGGWRLVDGWDPMIDPARIPADLGRPSPASARDIVAYMAGQPLQFEPGSEFGYSNFGYGLLGRAIERVTMRSYIDYLRDEVLGPLGIRGVEAGRSLPKDRNPREPEYVHPGTARNLFSTDPDAKVVHPDGGLAMEALDSSCGLIAPAADVARFFSRHGGPDGRPDPPGDEHRIYFGDLPGTFAMALRLPGNLVIVVLCNQRVSVSGSPMFALAGLMEQAAAKVQSWPTKEVDTP